MNNTPIILTLCIILFSLAQSEILVSTNDLESGLLKPCSYEVYKWSFTIANPERSVVLVDIDASVESHLAVGDFIYDVFFDYELPNDVTVGSGVPVCMDNIPVGVTSRSCTVPRSCELSDSNTLYVTVRNQGSQDLTYNITFLVQEIEQAEISEIIMESFEREHKFTRTRITDTNLPLNPYTFHRIAFTDEFRDEISLVSSFTIIFETINTTKRDVYLSYSHLPLLQPGCGDLGGEALFDNEDETFKFSFSSCDIANIDSIYISFYVFTDDSWRITIRPNSDPSFVSVPIRPNDLNLQDLVYSSTLAKTKFFEVNTAGEDFSGKEMSINIKNIGTGSVTLYQVTPSCRESFIMCKPTEIGCKYVFTECELKRWRDLGLNVFTFGVRTSDIDTQFTFSADIVEVPVNSISINQGKPVEITDKVGLYESLHYEINLQAKNDYLTCDHQQWLNIYVYVNSEHDYVNLYLNRGEYSSLGDSECGSSTHFCSVIDNQITSLVRGCGFQINSCELYESVKSNENWFISIQGSRPLLSSEPEVYHSDISFTLTVDLVGPQLLDSKNLPAIISDKIENTFYSRQYLIPSSSLKEGRHYSLRVSYFSNDDSPLVGYLRYGDQAGDDGCLDNDDTFDIDYGTYEYNIYTCWDTKDPRNNKDIFFSFKGTAYSPLVKEYVISLDLEDEGEVINLKPGKIHNGEMFVDDKIQNFTITRSSSARSVIIKFEPEVFEPTLNYEITVYPTSFISCTHGPIASIKTEQCSGPCIIHIDGCNVDAKDLSFTLERRDAIDAHLHRYKVSYEEVIFSPSNAKTLSLGSHKECSHNFNRALYRIASPEADMNLVVRVYFDAWIDFDDITHEWEVTLYSEIDDLFPCTDNLLPKQYKICTDDQECSFGISACELSPFYFLQVTPQHGYRNVPRSESIRETCYTIEIFQTEALDKSLLKYREGRFGEIFGLEGKRIGFELKNLTVNDPHFRAISRLSIDLNGLATWTLLEDAITRPIDQENIDSCSCDQKLNFLCTENPCVHEFHWCQINEDIAGRLNVYLQPTTPSRISYSVMLDDFQNDRFRPLSIDGTYRALDFQNRGYKFFINEETTTSLTLRFRLYDSEIFIYANPDGPATSECGEEIESTCNAKNIVPPSPFFECAVTIPNCEGTYYRYISVEARHLTDKSSIQYSAEAEQAYETITVNTVNSGLAMRGVVEYKQINLDSRKFYLVNITAVQNQVSFILKTGTVCNPGSVITNTGNVFSRTLWLRPCDLDPGINTYNIEILNTVSTEPGTNYYVTFEEYEFEIISLEDGVVDQFDFEPFLNDPESYYRIYKFQSTPNTDDLYTTYRYTVDNLGVQVYEFISDTDIGINALSASDCNPEIGPTFADPQYIKTSPPCCNEGEFVYLLLGESSVSVTINTLVETVTEVEFRDAKVGDTLTNIGPSTGFATNYRVNYVPESREEYLSIRIEGDFPVVGTANIDTYVNYNTPAGNGGCLSNIYPVQLQDGKDGNWRIFPCEDPVDLFFAYQSSIDTATISSLSFTVKKFTSLSTGTQTLNVPANELSIFYFDIDVPEYGEYSDLDYLDIRWSLSTVSTPIDFYGSLNGLTPTHSPPFTLATNLIPTCAEGSELFNYSPLSSVSLNEQYQEILPLCSLAGDRIYLTVEGNNNQDISINLQINYARENHTILDEGEEIYIEDTDMFGPLLIDTSTLDLDPLDYILIHIYNITGPSNFELNEGCNNIETCTSTTECIILLTSCELNLIKSNVFTLTYDALSSFTVSYSLEEIEITQLTQGKIISELAVEKYIQIYQYPISQTQAFAEFTVEDNCNSDFTTVITRGAYSTCRSNSFNHLETCDTQKCTYSPNCETLFDDIYITVFSGQSRTNTDIPMKYAVSVNSFSDSRISKTLTKGDSVKVTISDASTLFRMDYDRSSTSTSPLIVVEINPEIVQFTTVVVDYIYDDRCNPKDTIEEQLTPLNPTYVSDYSSLCLNVNDMPQSAVVRFLNTKFVTSVNYSDTSTVIATIYFTQPKHYYRSVLTSRKGALYFDSRSISGYTSTFPLENDDSFNTAVIYRDYWLEHNTVNSVFSGDIEFVEIGSDNEKPLRDALSSRFVANVTSMGENQVLLATKLGEDFCEIGSPQCIADGGTYCIQYLYPEDIHSYQKVQSSVYTLSEFADFELISGFENPQIVLENGGCYEFSEEPTFFTINDQIGPEQVYHFTIYPSAILDERMFVDTGSLNFELSSNYLKYTGNNPTFLISNADSSLEVIWRCPPTYHRLYDFFSMAVTVKDFPPFARLNYEIIDVNLMELSSGVTVNSPSINHFKYTTTLTENGFILVLAEGNPNTKVYVSSNVVNQGCDDENSLNICEIPATGVCSIIISECNPIESDITYYIYAENQLTSIAVTEKNDLSPTSVSVNNIRNYHYSITNGPSLFDRVLVFEVDLINDPNTFYNYEFEVTYSDFGTGTTHFILPTTDECKIENGDIIQISDCDDYSSVTIIVIAETYDFCVDFPIILRLNNEATGTSLLTDTVSSDYSELVLSFTGDGSYYTISTGEIDQNSGIETYVVPQNGYEVNIEDCEGNSNRRLYVCDASSNRDYYYKLVPVNIGTAREVSATVYGRIFQRRLIRFGETIQGSLSSVPYASGNVGLAEHYYFTYPTSNPSILVIRVKVLEGQSIQVRVGNCKAQYILDCFQYDEECIIEFSERENFNHLQALEETGQVYIDIFGSNSIFEISLPESGLCTEVLEGEADFCSGLITGTPYKRGDFVSQDNYAEIYYNRLVDLFTRCDDGQCKTEAPDCDITDACLDAIRKFSCNAAFPQCDTFSPDDVVSTGQLSNVPKDVCLEVEQKCEKTFSDVTLYGYNCSLGHYTDDISGALQIESVLIFILALVLLW